MACPPRSSFGARREVVVDVVLRDLAPRRQPDLVVAGDVREHRVERGDAVRLADQIRVQRHAHHRAGFRAFLVQLVELRLADGGVALGRRVAADEERDVVDLERIGDADQLPGAGLDRRRLVVMRHVEGVEDALLGQHMLRRLVVGDRRRQPAIEALAGGAQDGLAAVADQLALHLLVHVVEIPGVVGAVAEQLPAQLAAALDHFRVVVADRDVQRDATRARRTSPWCRPCARSRSRLP